MLRITWCLGLVAVPKPKGKVRICVDLIQLNAAVQREIHPIPSVDDNMTKLGKSIAIFTKLHANSGFWKVSLDEESKLLTTFFTPLGCYCFNRCPFGINSAPVIFQRAMAGILEGLEGTIYQMDNIPVHSANQEEHDNRTRAIYSTGYKKQASPLKRNVSSPRHL